MIIFGTGRLCRRKTEVKCQHAFCVLFSRNIDFLVCASGFIYALFIDFYENNRWTH